MHQYLFFIGDFPIRAYGTMLALAIICGASVAYVLLKKDGRGWHEHIIDFSITVAVAGLIGARLWDVFFFDWDYYGNHLLEIPFVWQGGIVYYLIVKVLAILLGKFERRLKESD